jgi:hypothetical protein
MVASFNKRSSWFIHSENALALAVRGLWQREKEKSK